MLAFGLARYCEVMKHPSKLVTIPTSRTRHVLHVTAGFPCIIGKNVTVGHRAIVHGCRVEDGALIGMGAIVLDGAVIGRRALVGAGAVIPPGMIVPAGMLALGVPAKVVGPLNEKQKGAGQTAVSHYVARKEQYRKGEF